MPSVVYRKILNIYRPVLLVDLKVNSVLCMFCFLCLEYLILSWTFLKKHVKQGWEPWPLLGPTLEGICRSVTDKKFRPSRAKAKHLLLNRAGDRERGSAGCGSKHGAPKRSRI